MRIISFNKLKWFLDFLPIFENSGITLTLSLYHYFHITLVGEVLWWGVDEGNIWIWNKDLNFVYSACSCVEVSRGV